MNTKNVLLIGISVFAISLLLTSPVLASADETLDIYGNANEDDTIDMRDLTYVKLIFFGKKPETELSDAKYDGKINPLDFVQIKLIIVGKEKQLTLVDGADRIVTVNKPVERIIASGDKLEAMRTLKAKDKVVAVSTYITKKTLFFPEFSKLPAVGDIDHFATPDYEKIYELEPDILIVYLPSAMAPGAFEVMMDRLEPTGIKVLAFNLVSPSTIGENMKKLGYVLDKREEAEEFIDFYEGIMKPIEEQVEGILEENKPRLFYEFYSTYKTFTKSGFYQVLIVTAGGINIAADLPGSTIKVDPEWVIEQNPDIVVHQTCGSKAACGYGVDDPVEVKALRDSILSRPELTEVDAVKNRKVYVIEAGIAYSRSFIGTAYIAKWLHPELFEDLDPKRIHQEYLTRFQELDYDLDKHGVFVYPEP